MTNIVGLKPLPEVVIIVVLTIEYMMLVYVSKGNYPIMIFLFPE